MSSVKRKYFKLVALLLVGAFMASCGVTKHLREDEYLLTSNKIETDKERPRSERINSRELKKYTRQNPTKKFLGTNLPSWIYFQADSTKDNGWNNFLRRLGSKPVILDTILTERSVVDLKAYMDSRGFFQSYSWYDIKYREKAKKASVTYGVHQDAPYRLRNITYDFRDNFLEKLISEDSASTKLHSGEIFDVENLRSERNRIADYLHNRGYYNFSVDNITFIADSTVGNRDVDLTMVVRQYLDGFDDEGNPIYENNSVYRLRNIYVYPDYNPTEAATDSTYALRLDTTYYHGLNVISHGKPKVNAKTLRTAIKIYPDYTYSAADVQQSYSGIMRLGIYRSASILFSEIPAAPDNIITFIGDDEEEIEASAPVEVAEKYIDCVILCTAGQKQSYTVDLEGSMTSTFYGLKATGTYQNKNIFQGAEIFEFGVTGGYEFYKSQKNPNSFEIGGTTSLTIPRFLTPFPVDRANVSINPQTRAEVSITQQNRPIYERLVSGASWSYSWANRRYSRYTFRPLDFNIVDVKYIDDAFKQTIEETNKYLANSFESKVILGISGSYFFNNPMTTVKGNAVNFRFNWETAGNLLNGITALADKREAGEDFYRIFGIQYAQYFRVDGSFSNKIALGGVTSLVYRLYGGIGLTYGNSKNNAMPYDRLFYAGGGTSMRGWGVRTLGPGSVTVPISNYPSQVGDMKLEANLEFRFPIWNQLHGAVFFDVGNVWNVKHGHEQEESIFRFNTFYKQLGFNTGLGLRYDLNMVVIRLDWGMQLHNPNAPHGEKWRFSAKGSNTAFNFAIGYPF